MRQPGMHKIENLSTSIRGFPVPAKRTLYQRLTPKCQEMAFFLKNPMMNSFGRQEGGGFRRREGKLVSPVRRDYPLHQQTDRREKEGEETRRKSERNPPLKSPPGKEEEEEEEKKVGKKVSRKRGGRGEKKMLTREKKQ